MKTSSVFVKSTGLLRLSRVVDLDVSTFSLDLGNSNNVTNSAELSAILTHAI
jgi:hypothetical protein